jgi:hypothetical protein
LTGATLFRLGGDPWGGISDAVALLPSRKLRAIATDVLRHLVFLYRKGELDERATDRAIAEALDWSVRTVQRALHALHRVLGGMGWAIIDRIRQHGRRIITFVRGNAKSGSRPDPIAPQTPLLEEEKNTTIGEGSSSSVQSSPERPQEPIPAVDPALVERACRLIPGPQGADAGKVAAAVADSGYTTRGGEVMTGEDAVRHALDEVERQNNRAARDGRLKVYSWGKVLGILHNRKRENWVPPKTAPPPRPEPPRPAPEPEPVQRLTAEEVAELVRRCQSASRFDLPALARSQLRAALSEGAISPELAATIPAEIHEDPRAP